MVPQIKTIIHFTGGENGHVASYSGVGTMTAWVNEVRVMKTGSLEVIREFLRHKRWAMVGVSRRKLDFSRWLLGQFRRRGYEVVAVNPHTAELDGIPCHPRLSAIQPPPEVVLVLTRRRHSAAIARDAAAAGVGRIWFYAAAGSGAAAPEALAFCREAGIQVVAGYCPMMFLDQTPWLHRAHAAFLKLVGAYPPGASGADGGRPEAG